MTELSTAQAGLGTAAAPLLVLPNPPARAHVFLSYSRSDTELVVKLAADRAPNREPNLRYTIVIRSAWTSTTGAYTLIIESRLLESIVEPGS